MLGKEREMIDGITSHSLHTKQDRIYPKICSYPRYDIYLWIDRIASQSEICIETIRLFYFKK